jgi:hypothetical protein
MTHRHYTASWPRCRECGAIAADCSEYCDDCNNRLDAENAAQVAADEAEAAAIDAAADAAILEAACTCSTSFVPGNAHSPPKRIPDCRCPVHGDRFDPDRAYDERRDAAAERYANHDPADRNED